MFLIKVQLIPSVFFFLSCLSNDINKKSYASYDGNSNYKDYNKKEKIVIININDASKDDLMKIYGIGDAISDRILKQKEVFGRIYIFIGFPVS